MQFAQIAVKKALYPHRGQEGPLRQSFSSLQNLYIYKYIIAYTIIIIIIKSLVFGLLTTKKKEDSQEFDPF